MKLILMVDGLDIKNILKYRCKNLLLKYPKVVMHDFKFIYTPYIWEAFLTGKRRKIPFLNIRISIYYLIKIFERKLFKRKIKKIKLYKKIISIV